MDLKTLKRKSVWSQVPTVYIWMKNPQSERIQVKRQYNKWRSNKNWMNFTYGSDPYGSALTVFAYEKNIILHNLYNLQCEPGCKKNKTKKSQ